MATNTSTQKTTTRPSRARGNAATPAKATAAKAAPKAAEPEAPAEEVPQQKITFELEKLDDTKSYSVFTPPADSGCVGKIYVPLGATAVKILIVGPAE